MNLALNDAKLERKEEGGSRGEREVESLEDSIKLKSPQTKVSIELSTLDIAETS